MQIHQCDICGIIGRPGIRWVRINLMPFTIQQPNRYENCVNYEELYMDVCSMECAAEKIREWDFIEIKHEALKGTSMDECRPVSLDHIVG